MKTILAITLFSAIVSTTAFADGSNVYLVGELGSATYQNVSPFPNPGKIGLGASYHFDKNLAAEVGYTIFGNSIVTSGSNSATLH